MGLRFDSLCSILEERKKELLQSIAREQEAKVQRVRGLIRQYGDHLEASSKLVETAIQAMEEPQMAVYLQVSGGAVCGGLCPVPRGSVRCSWDADGTLLSPTALQGAPEEVSGGGRGRDGDGMGGGKVGGAHAACSTPRITDMSKVSMSSRPEPGYESMDHFSINVDHVAEMLRTIDFQPGANMGRALPWGGEGGGGCCGDVLTLKCASAPQKRWVRTMGTDPQTAVRVWGMRRAWRHPRLLRVSVRCAVPCYAVLQPPWCFCGCSVAMYGAWSHTAPRVPPSVCPLLFLRRCGAKAEAIELSPW